MTAPTQRPASNSEGRKRKAERDAIKAAALDDAADDLAALGCSEYAEKHLRDRAEALRAGLAGWGGDQ